MLSLPDCTCGDDGPGLSKLRAQIALSPTELDFGDVPLGATKSLTISVENKGSDLLQICLADTHIPGACADKTLVDPASQPFKALFESPSQDTGAWTVERSEKRDFSVTFTPLAEGRFSATLIIAHNAFGSPTRVPLNGGGVAPRVDFSGDVLDFGEVTVGRRKTLELTLTNRTQFPQPVTIAPIPQMSVIFGTETPGIGDTPPGQSFQSLVPGNSALTINVWFQPPEEGPHTNVLRVTYCPTCSKDVGVRGVGVKPAYELIPPALDFGSVDIGTQATRSFVVRNVGNVRLTVNAIGIERGTTAEFATRPQGNLPAAIPPGQELTVNVTYDGMTAGMKTGRVQVDTDAWEDPATMTSRATGYVNLRAVSTGANIHALPETINFGTVSVGSMASRNLVLENIGNSPLTISNIMLSSPSRRITMSNVPGLPAVVQAGTSVQLTLRFQPISPGQDEGDVIVTSNDRATPMLRVHAIGIGGSPNGCSIAVTPTQMTFGLVERGRTVMLPAEIRNSGALPCTVSQIRLMGGAEFTITAGMLPMVSIAPGMSHRVTVAYHPADYGMHSTLLLFSANDPGQPMVQVPISGSSAPTDLRVVPSQLDFGIVPLNCHSPSRIVTLYNTGSNPVTISQVYLDPSTPMSFELQPYTVPMTIPPGGQSVITIRYRPTAISIESGVLFIVHSAARMPVAVPLTGEGQNMPTVTETFRQNVTPKVDALFVVDNSGSMQWAQQNLGNNLGAFIASAQAMGVDYHIAVTTTDVETPNSNQIPFLSRYRQGGGARGAFCDAAPARPALCDGRSNSTNRYISSTTPNAANVFRGIIQGLGTDGSSLETALEAAYLALSDPLINTTNAGFLRDDAALAVIVVSDDDDMRDDNSPVRPGTPHRLSPRARPVAFYENFLRNIKGFQNPSMFSFNVVAVLVEGMCNALSQQRVEAQGARYLPIAMSTGGVAESICNQNWGQTLTNIGANTFGLRRQFSLSSEPVPATIQVTVNGTTVSSTSGTGQQNWTYDPMTHSVSFGAMSARRRARRS